jgi:hypothetical protein
MSFCNPPVESVAIVEQPTSYLRAYPNPTLEGIMTEPSAAHIRGFRLADLLVLLAIGAILCAFFVPAVQSVRAQSARVNCTDNLRRIALACHNCNDALGSMPPYQVGENRGLPKNNYYNRPGNRGTAFFFLLPFVEEASAYNAGSYYVGPSPTGGPFQNVAYSVYATYSPKGPGHGPGPKGLSLVKDPPRSPFVGQMPIQVYQCPWDPTLGPHGVQQVTGWGSCSYACNYLVFGNPKAVKEGKPALDNPDGYDPKANPPHIVPAALPKIGSSFPDGTSNTLLFAEKYSVCNWYMAGSATEPKSGGNLWAWPGENASYGPAFAMESPWNDGTRFQLRPKDSDCNVAYPSSGHQDAMAVAMADASVRAIRRSVSQTTWLALCTPNGGDTLGNDF